MYVCKDCQGEVESGSQHKYTGECIRILTARVNAIFHKMGVAPGDRDNPIELG